MHKQSCRIGLSIGDSFAELRAWSAAQNIATQNIGQTRWYFGRKNLADGLAEALQKISSEHGAQILEKGILQIGTSRVERAIERRQGAHSAILVTGGFENRLKLPEMKSLPVDPGLVFGVTGRIARDGSISLPFKVEDLEFFAAKFELLKVKTVALLFVNSLLCPEFERTARNFFLEKGYRVVGAHDVDPVLSDNLRWRSIVEFAYAESAVDELRKQVDAALEKALGENREAWQVKLWGKNGLCDWSEFSGAKAHGGIRAACAQMTPLPLKFSLHLGLEMFQLLKGTPTDGDYATVLPFRPTYRIGLGDWPFPTLTNEDVGFEPGPMLFGKSQQLTFLDLLYTQGKLQEVEGFTALISERSRPRILESILTLARVIPREDTTSPIDARAVAQDLETACIERVCGALSMHGVRGEITLTGVFAETFLPLLKQRRPDLSFMISENAAWAEADACGRLPA